MITATRRIQFAAGHRVFGHEGKCRYLHGHNFVAFLTAAADDLDAVGRVIDFGVLKERVGGWIERAWDHGFVVWQDDAEARRALALVDGQKTYLLGANPTADEGGPRLGVAVLQRAAVIDLRHVAGSAV